MFMNPPSNPERQSQIAALYSEVDPKLHNFATDFVYGQIWAWGGLTEQQKSAVTLAALIIIDCKPLLELELAHFMRLPGAAACYLQILDLLQTKGFIDNAEDFRALAPAGTTSDATPDETLNAMIELTGFLVRGDNEQTRAQLTALKEQGTLSEQQIRAVMRQQMFYAGCPCAMNGFAMLLDAAFPESDDTSSTTLPELSSAMTELYGDQAQAVYDRCQELDPIFNQFVQDVIYEQLWHASELNMLEKSIVTITTLAVLNKAEQLTIHFKGFVKLGGTPALVEQLFDLLEQEGFIPSRADAAAIYEQVQAEIGATPTPTESIDTQRLLSIAKVAATVTQGQTDETTLSDKLATEELDADTASAVMRHQMIYSGLARTVTGLTALKQAQAATPRHK